MGGVRGSEGRPASKLLLGLTPSFLKCRPSDRSLVARVFIGGLNAPFKFYCEDCKRPFEIILSLAEYEKGKVKCPKCGGQQVHQEVAAFFAVTSKKS